MTVQWNTIVLILTLLLAAGLLWLEYRRPLKRWRVLRLLAAALAMVSLAILGIPVTFSTLPRSITREAIITTGGFSTDSIQQFTRRTGKLLPLYTSATLLQIPAGTYNKVHVFGHGLSASELQQLPASIQVVPHLTSPSGITHIYWQQHITQGQPVQVQGRYNNTGNTPVLLQLNGEHTRLDTITIPANTDSSFALTALPVHTGKAVYELFAISDGDTLAKEPVPLEVSLPTALSVLVLASSPGFEHRFIVNWLSDNGYAVAARTAISKNKFQYTYANRQHVPLEQLTTATLSVFDIVICDALALKSSSAAEQAAIREQAGSKGMGVLLLADSTALPALFNSASFVLQMPGASPQPFHIQLPGTATITTLPPAPPLYIVANPALQPLIYDAQQHLRSAAGLYGAGHLLISTLNATYSWQLSGNQQAYSTVWSTLLQQAARRSFTGAYWQPQSFIPLVNQPVMLELTTTDTLPAPGIVNESRLAMAQRPLLPFQWQGTYWPVIAGWQSITTATGNNWWYAYAPQQWAQVKATEKAQATRHYANGQTANSNGAGYIQPVVKPLPPMYAWLMLLLCCSFLWWESKTRYTGRKKR